MAKLDALIKKLTRIQEKYGNIQVVYDQYGVYRNTPYRLSGIKVAEAKTDPKLKIDIY